MLSTQPCDDFHKACREIGEGKSSVLEIWQAWEGGAWFSRSAMFSFLQAANHCKKTDCKVFSRIWEEMTPGLLPAQKAEALGLMVHYGTPLHYEWAETMLSSGIALDPSYLPLFFQDRAGRMKDEKILADKWRQWSRRGWLVAGWQTHKKILEVVEDEHCKLASGVLLDVFFSEGVPLKSGHDTPWAAVWAYTHKPRMEEWLASDPDKTRSAAFRMLDAYLRAGGDFSCIAAGLQEQISQRRVALVAKVLDDSPLAMGARRPRF